MGNGYYHVHATDLSTTRGAQNQVLQPAVHSGVAQVNTISAGLICMPGGHYSEPHTHENTEIIVHVFGGFAATLVTDDLIPEIHTPGSIMQINPGVVHAAVNLDRELDALAFEARAGDPTFAVDTVPRPEFAAAVAERAAQLQRDYLDGAFDRLNSDTQQRISVVGGGR